MMYELPLFISCGGCGAFAGLLGGGFNQCTPVWIGTAAGGSLGCVLSIVNCYFQRIIEKRMAAATLTSAAGAAGTADTAAAGIAAAGADPHAPVVVHNIYVVYDVATGQAKTISEDFRLESVKQNTNGTT